MVAEESRGYQRRSRQSPQLQAERGVGGVWGGGKGNVYQRLHITEAAAGCQTEICGCGADRHIP